MGRRTVQVAGVVAGLAAAAALLWALRGSGAGSAGLGGDPIPPRTSLPPGIATAEDPGPARAEPPPPSTAPAASEEAARRRFAEASDRLDRALNNHDDLVKPFPKFTSAWWDAKCDQLEVMEQAGKHDTVRQLLENLRLLVPELGGPDHAPRLRNLAKRLGLTTGW